MRKVWFIDSNIIAHWIMGRGGVLELLVSDMKLSSEFLDIYRNRYQFSIQFVDLILNRNPKNKVDEIFLSGLALNELFSAVRDEVQAIYLFQNGVPLSKWRDPGEKVNIDAETYQKVYDRTLISFDQLFGKALISIIVDKYAADDEQYLNIISSLLFLYKNTKTQDVTLLTTAILHHADYFVTQDHRLRDSVKNICHEKYQLDIISVKTGIQKLK